MKLENSLSSKQVMDFLGIKSQTTLIDYESKGRLKIAFRIGNKKRYFKKDVERFIKEAY